MKYKEFEKELNFNRKIFTRKNIKNILNFIKNNESLVTIYCGGRFIDLDRYLFVNLNFNTLEIEKDINLSILEKML